MDVFFFPGSAGLLSAACLLFQWGGVKGLEEGRAFVVTHKLLFLPGVSCCVTPVPAASLHPGDAAPSAGAAAAARGFWAKG